MVICTQTLVRFSLILWPCNGFNRTPIARPPIFQLSQSEALQSVTSFQAFNLRSVLLLIQTLFEMGSKLEIPTTLRYSPLLLVSEGGRVKIITIDLSDTITQKSEVCQRPMSENEIVGLVPPAVLHSSQSGQNSSFIRSQ